MSHGDSLHLAVALDGAGWHPAAWRQPEARPDELFSGRYWADQVVQAELGGLDFVTIEDGLGLQSSRWAGPDDRVDQVRGRLDAVLIAARVAPLTSRIGLVPTATTTHPEPFHISKAIATLDYVSQGRAGWRAQVSARAVEADHFGRRSLPSLSPRSVREDPALSQVADDLFDEAADFIEVVRRLWDSWEDDAEIRDAASGRFVDREKLHYIDFQGRWFNVRGPAITPRPPQGQPLVTLLAHTSSGYRLAVGSADAVFVTPSDEVTAGDQVAEIRDLERQAGRSEPLRIFADLGVVLDRPGQSAASRQDQLDESHQGPAVSDAASYAGPAGGLADQLANWHRLGIDGFRLRPAVLPIDLAAITQDLVPELRRRGLRPAAYDGSTLRHHLGLDRPPNRYAVA